jgi:MoaA/NifB/PqqE/SkfB family radical SAM enzyme
MKVHQDGYIQLTLDCNHECVFCTQPKSEIYMALEDIKKRIIEYKKAGFTRFIFTGGEPTLHPDLLAIAKWVCDQGVELKMITNGSKLADKKFCRKIVDAGLKHVVVSIHTHKSEIARKISTKTDLNKTLKGVRNMVDAGAIVTINTTIISLNYPYLSEFARFMVKKFPEIGHYVFNFVEIGGRAAENKWVVPKYSDIELELGRTLNFLYLNRKSFRVERVPLCYMGDFQAYSSETRRKLGNQEYVGYFLRHKESQTTNEDTVYNIQYEKSEDCKICFLSTICAGVKSNYIEKYGLEELYPLFKPVKQFIDMNLSD